MRHFCESEKKVSLKNKHLSIVAFAASIAIVLLVLFLIVTLGRIKGEGNLVFYGGQILSLAEPQEAIPVGDAALSYDVFISSTWDMLMDELNTMGKNSINPDRELIFSVTKETIGHSSTTSDITREYPIYKYVFTPRDWEKTVLLTAGCHGDEYEGFWGLYRLMKLMYSEGYKYPMLRSMRDRVRFIIVPVWNPWGVETRQRNCPIGFPANDNLNSAVTLDEVSYPAFSSLEAQSIKTVIDEYHGELSLWCDLHTDPHSIMNGWRKGCYGYAPSGSEINKILYSLTWDFHNIIQTRFGYDTLFWVYNTDSSFKSKIRGSGIVGYGTFRSIPTALLEVSVDEWATSGSPEEMTTAVEWFGSNIANMILGA